jgi:hypothetical protein
VGADLKAYEDLALCNINLTTTTKEQKGALRIALFAQRIHRAI